VSEVVGLETAVRAIPPYNGTGTNDECLLAEIKPTKKKWKAILKGGYEKNESPSRKDDGCIEGCPGRNRVSVGASGSS
jgi:hypothetical protein